MTSYLYSSIQAPIATYMDFKFNVVYMNPPPPPFFPFSRKKKKKYQL